MRRNPFYTSFDLLGNPAHRTVQGWRRRSGGPRWQTAARTYARIHGEARALLASGRVVRYWWDGARVRQRTYTEVYF